MHRRSNSSLLLAELVISIFFFLAAAAVSVQIFAAAKRQSDQAAENRNLAELVRNCGESFSSAEGDPEKTLSGLSIVYPSLEWKDGTGKLSLSDDLSEEEGGKAVLAISFSGESSGTGTLHKMALTVTLSDGTQEYERTLEYFAPGGEEANS